MTLILAHTRQKIFFLNLRVKKISRCKTYALMNGQRVKTYASTAAKHGRDVRKENSFCS